MKSPIYDPIKQVVDDGLFISDVGAWAEEKYKLVGQYANMFTTAMHKKWDELIYIDLFANCGYARIKEKNKIIQSSSLIALNLPIRFSKYIICEQQDKPFNALKQRVERDYNGVNVEFICGDSNRQIELIISKIPQHSTQKKILTFCFVDPYNISSLEFETIRKLSAKFMDFLILLPLYMDANRNLKPYFDEKSKKIEKFLGQNNWRDKFSDESNFDSFVQFLAHSYDNNMKGLNFENNQMHLIKANHLKLYYLAFYSRNELGSRFWNTIQKYSTGQQSLF